MSESTFSQELDALGVVLKALEPLNEEKRLFILKSAIDRLQVKGIGFGHAGSAISTEDASQDIPVDEAEGIPISVKKFLKNKEPNSDVQRVICLAFYLSHYRHQKSYKSEDIVKITTESTFPPFGNVTKIVNNASQRNHFFSPAGEGKKQLSPLGEDVVNALPDQIKVKEIIAKWNKLHKPKPKKKAQKKA